MEEPQTKAAASQKKSSVHINWAKSQKKFVVKIKEIDSTGSIKEKAKDR